MRNSVPLAGDVGLDKKETEINEKINGQYT
jgi:hypothetical protein